MDDTFKLSTISALGLCARKRGPVSGHVQRDDPLLQRQESVVLVVPWFLVLGFELG